MFSGIIYAITRLPFFCRLNALKLTLWGDFAKVEGNYLSHNLFSKNVILASRLFVRDAKVCILFIDSNNYILYFLFHIVLSFIGMLTNIVIYFLGFILLTTPRNRLLINPPMEYTSEFEGWYIKINNFVHFKIWLMISLVQYCTILICICLVVFDACARWIYDGYAQRRLMLIRQRRLRIPNLEKLFVARQITLSEYFPIPNVPLSSFCTFI